MENPVIEIHNLRKEFTIKQKTEGFIGSLRSLVRPKYKQITAVDSISLSVQRGEILAFIGPNGAGKSTTIKMLIGILFPTSGIMTVLGYNPYHHRQKLAYSIGSVFGQKPQLWYHLPPIDTYNLFSKIYELDPKRYKKRLDFLIGAFEIQDFLKTPVRKLSLGQRMRCEVVASLLHEPKIIFLDEPTIGLDVIAKQHIREVIRYLNEEEKVTIFLTSHDAGDVEALAKRTIVINYGKIIFDGPTETLKNRFIRSKIIELISGNPIQEFSFQGGKVIEKTKYSLKVELDTSRVPIDRLLHYAVKQYDIKDINIFDPSMEEIITHIYKA